MVARRGANRQLLVVPGTQPTLSVPMSSFLNPRRRPTIQKVCITSATPQQSDASRSNSAKHSLCCEWCLRIFTIRRNKIQGRAINPIDLRLQFCLFVGTKSTARCRSNLGLVRYCGNGTSQPREQTRAVGWWLRASLPVVEVVNDLQVSVENE